MFLIFESKSDRTTEFSEQILLMLMPLKILDCLTNFALGSFIEYHYKKKKSRIRLPFRFSKDLEKRMKTLKISLDYSLAKLELKELKVRSDIYW